MIDKPRTRTKEDIRAIKLDDQLDFNLLLEPYKQGGLPEDPVERTMGTIYDYLLNKKKYPMEIAGAAVLKTFIELKAGMKFDGDGSYGSPGRELVTYIRCECDAMLRRKLEHDGYAYAKAIIDAAREKRTFRDKWRNWMKTGHWR